MAAMDDTEHIQHALHDNDAQAAWMEHELTALGYKLIPTWTNFVALDVDEDAREFARRLRRKGVLVRPLSVWGAPTSIRVTLGTPEQNQFFVSVLASMK
jgi:histidinol-phosphate aminotransferase